MARSPEDLGMLEQQVMLACLRQHPNAYGISIGDEIQKRTGKEYSPGSLYAAIERLEVKGYLERRVGEATASRGGRAKVYFVVTGEGRSTLDRAFNAIDAMRSGVGLPGVST